MKKFLIFQTALVLNLISATILFSACRKEQTVPTVTTTEISEITQTGAVSGGNIISDGGSPIISCGVCWSTEQSPFLDFKTDEGGGKDSFTSNITRLAPNTLYYVRAYAATPERVGFGNEVSFTTNPMEILFKAGMNYGSVSDIDGNTYKTIHIGTQTWMAENLRTTKLNDGAELLQRFVTVEAVGHYNWYNDNMASFQGYGALYDWKAVKSGKLCPAGWHVPELQEWTTLVNYLGGMEVAGGKLKEEGKAHWSSPNTGGTNESGFTALPAGTYNTSRPDIFEHIGDNGRWWSATLKSATNKAGCLNLSHDLSKVVTLDYTASLTDRSSVRCVMD